MKNYSLKDQNFQLYYQDKTILRNFIEREVMEKVEFFNISVNHPYSFKNYKNIYSGAKTEAYIHKLKQENLITDADVVNFKKHVG
jgi:hypothetical protein